MPIDLFGNEKEYPVEVKKTTTGTGKYQVIKRHLGYKKSDDKSKCCKNCGFHQALDYHNKTYHKCEKIGISNGTATDIRVSNVCKVWKLKGG